MSYNLVLGLAVVICLRYIMSMCFDGLGSDDMLVYFLPRSLPTRLRTASRECMAGQALVALPTTSVAATDQLAPVHAERSWGIQLI